jgi:hypothetical protein
MMEIKHGGRAFEDSGVLRIRAATLVGCVG